MLFLVILETLWYNFAFSMSGQMDESSFFFIQMSDQQFGMYSGNGEFIRETDLYEKAVSHANRLSPAFILNTGDLVNSPGDESQLFEAMRITRKLDKSIPVYSIPGNHDVADDPTEASLEWYRKRIGKDRYFFDFGLDEVISENF
jgi:3',5'-cyclic AMP phosphodiesterase CpdA